MTAIGPQPIGRHRAVDEGNEDLSSLGVSLSGVVTTCWRLVTALVTFRTDWQWSPSEQIEPARVNSISGKTSFPAGVDPLHGGTSNM
jgi:hypothetical protein